MESWLREHGYAYHVRYDEANASTKMEVAAEGICVGRLAKQVFSKSLQAMRYPPTLGSRGGSYTTEGHMNELYSYQRLCFYLHGDMPQSPSA